MPSRRCVNSSYRFILVGSASDSLLNVSVCAAWDVLSIELVADRVLPSVTHVCFHHVPSFLMASSPRHAAVFWTRHWLETDAWVCRHVGQTASLYALEIRVGVNTLSGWHHCLRFGHVVWFS